MGFINQFCNFRYWGTGGNMFMGIILVLLVIGVLYALFRPSIREKDDSALRILKNRLASGEISEEEFERMKNILKK